MPGEDVYKALGEHGKRGGRDHWPPRAAHTEDDAATPGNGISDAQTLISAHVDAIVDLSEVDTTWASAVQKANIPVIGTYATDEPFFTNPDFYPMGETGDSATVAYVSTIKAAGGSAFGDMVCAEAVVCSQYEQGLKAAGKQIGVPLTYVTSISATSPNYTAQCLAAKQKNIKYMIVEDPSAIIARVATDCDRQGYDPTYVIGGGSFGPAFETTPGLKASTWSYWPNLPYWDSAPVVQAMSTAVEKYYPGLQKNPLIWSGTSPLSWPSGLLLADAVKAVGLGKRHPERGPEYRQRLQPLKAILHGRSPPSRSRQETPPVDRRRPAASITAYRRCKMETDTQSGSSS